MEKPNVKKRGRKPKGGKIIEQGASSNFECLEQDQVNQNVILHLKCFKRDIEDATKEVESVEPFCSDTSFEPVANVPVDVELTIHQKVKLMASALRKNDVSKKADCFWCTCGFDTPTVFIPKNKVGGQYNVYGSFCCPECAAAYIFAEPHVDTTVKFERYHLLNFMYGKPHGYTKNFLPAPSPFYILDKFYGNLTIEEFRRLVRSEQHVAVLDKPICVACPELVQGNRNLVEKVGGETYKLCRKKVVEH